MVQSNNLVKFIFILFLIINFSSIASTLSFTDDTTPEFIFEQGITSDLLITCTDVDDSPCNSGFLCNVTVSYPNSSILINNQQATHQANWYNITLPNTDTLGIHSYAVFCTNGTNAGSASELTYLINLTGEDLSISKTILYIFVLIVSLVLFLLSLFGAIKIPWNNRTDDEDFIVGISNLKYIKLILWFISYIFLIFLSWLTASISKFLELGMASGFFDFIYLTLIVFVFPVFVIVTVTGIMKVFSDKSLNQLIGRNLRVK